MPLKPGEPALWFRGAPPSNPEFTFDSVGGPAGRQPLRLLLQPAAPGATRAPAGRRYASLPLRYDEAGAG